MLSAALTMARRTRALVSRMGGNGVVVLLAVVMVGLAAAPCGVVLAARADSHSAYPASDQQRGSRVLMPAHTAARAAGSSGGGGKSSDSVGRLPIVDCSGFAEQIDEIRVNNSGGNWIKVETCAAVRRATVQPCVRVRARSPVLPMHVHAHVASLLAQAATRAERWQRSVAALQHTCTCRLVLVAACATRVVHAGR